MKRPPRPTTESLFAGGLLLRIVVTGVVMAIGSLFIQWWSIQHGLPVRTQQTMVFTTLCFVQLGNALTVRSIYNSILTTKIFSNPRLWVGIVVTILLQLALIYVPFLQPIFKTTALEFDSMGMILLVTLSCVILIEILKYLLKKKHRPSLQKKIDKKI